MITLDDCPQLVNGVVGRIIENKSPNQTEAVLVVPQKGQVKVLNDVGARIWSLIDGQRSIREIVNHIVLEYDIELLQAETDSIDFIEELITKDIVTIVK